MKGILSELTEKNTVKPNEWEHHYPLERLEQMMIESTRDEMTGFISIYHRSIVQGIFVPYHWHLFASNVLYTAAYALSRDYSTYSGELAKVMKLDGRTSKEGRNAVICITIQQRVDQGETETAAQKYVGERLSMEPESIRRSIWPKRDKMRIERTAKDMPDFDFLGLPIAKL